MKYVFIVNPTAGKGFGEQIVKNGIEKALSEGKCFDYSIHITTKIGEAREIAQSVAASGEDVSVFAVGGDGTFFEVLNGVVGYDNASVGVVPTGSANDFLKCFDREKRDCFCDISDQIGGEAVPIDLIRCGEYYCINICSAGMDAVVADNMTRFKNLPLVNGVMAYDLAVVKTFLGKIGIKITITVDGETIPEKECLFAVCANGRCYGGSYNCAPRANPFDEKLDFVIVDKISKLKILGFLGKYKKGDIDDLSCCHIGRCEKMVIESDKTFPVNLDGEIMHFNKAEFEIVKKGVKFVVPNSVLSEVPRKLLTNLKQ